MTGKPIPAVAYAAKSTEGTRGSIPTQLADARKLVECEGMELAGREFSDEAKSAYKGNRGPNLARAMAECEGLAAEHGDCALIVQHSDRLARGDGKQAKHLVQYAIWTLEHSITIRSVQDPQTFSSDGLVYAALMGDWNTEDSKRRGAATHDGLKRRKERGAPVGPLPLGYHVQKTIVGDDQVITTRVMDPSGASLVERIFAMVENGATFGDAARAFNTEGITTRRGKPWTARTIRQVVHNRGYRGEKGSPTIIEPGRWDAIHASLKRLDPATVQRRKGGRKPTDESYFLRGLGFCLRCGGTLYTRKQAAGRMYVCRNRRQGTGLCDAPPIPAVVFEDHVVRHLNSFVGSVERWVVGLVRQQADDREGRLAALDRERPPSPPLTGSARST